MDSLSQAALGAAVGGVVMGRRHGWRAYAWGAALGTVPDLDSLVPFGGPVADFTYHRGYSHALVVVTAAAPLLAWLPWRAHARTDGGYRAWLATAWLILVTHVLLDACTIYGTQLLLPFTDYPVGLGSIFIIDPLYTLPLLIGIGAGLWRGGVPGAGWCGAGLALSTVYLAWTIAAQQLVEAHAESALARADIPAERMLATPAPFNSLLWRIVAVGEDAHWEGFHTLGSARPIEFTRYPNRPELLDGIEDRWAVRRLQAFTKGFYAVSEPGEPGAVVITDLRMGQAGFYAFAFVVGEREGEETEPVAVRRYEYGRPPIGVIVRELWACGQGRPTEVISC